MSLVPTTERKTIFVHPAADRIDQKIREAMLSLVPIRFADCPSLAACVRGDVVVSLSGTEDALDEADRSGLRCFHVTKGASAAYPEGEDVVIRFGRSVHLDKLFRERIIGHKPVANITAIQTKTGDQVLARVGECPVWIFRTTTGPGADIVSFSLPKMTGVEQPFDYLDGLRFMQLLPLLHFLRQVTSAIAWKRPRLMACFTFDDPNLHWPSYGHLSFGELIWRAKESNFHAAVATVPRDAWLLNQRTVELFKENHKHLSLLIHGNDHLRVELGRDLGIERYYSIVAQGLRRIADLEQRTGLYVPRVIVPPQEALIETAMLAMSQLGIEGASMTAWSIRHWNIKRDWKASFGLDITEMIHGCSPVIPRFKLSSQCEGLIVITAFLGRPIVAFGHHETVADGFKMISQTADLINSLGDVRRGNPEMMLRASYLTFQENSSLRIKIHSSRLVFRVKEGINTIIAETPDGECHPIMLRISGGTVSGAKSQLVSSATGVPISVNPRDTVELSLNKLGGMDYRTVAPPRYMPWAFPRRILCEGRDRLSPMISRRFRLN